MNYLRPQLADDMPYAGHDVELTTVQRDALLAITHTQLQADVYESLRHLEDTLDE